MVKKESEKSDANDDADTLKAFGDSETSSETEPTFSLQEISAIIEHNVKLGLIHLPQETV